jgi:hypothetical protein
MKHMIKNLNAILVISVTVLFGLSGCGGGAATTANPNTATVSPSNYSGPVPATADVQSFKLNVWDNLSASNRCGACHVEGDQAPEFVRHDDINTAYTIANSIVDLTSPQDSRMVTKVAGGHNCWLASDQACADVIQAYIEAWTGGVSGGSRAIQLAIPTIKDPGSTKQFPETSTGFGAIHTHLITTAGCHNCHRSESATPQAPFFAATDINEAFEAAKSKIDLNNPADSRLVVRLRDEFHNCWSGSTSAACGSDAGEIQALIEAYAGNITATSIDSNLVISKALGIGDGVVASGGSRHEANQIALYEFKTGSGDKAFDTSGLEPSMHLSLSGKEEDKDYEWVGGYGIKFNTSAAKAQALTSDSIKMHDLIKATSEYSIEAWVAPANVTQENANIVSYSGSATTRNFTLGQTQYNYDFFNRSSTVSVDANGNPALSTDDDDEDLQATLQHVVLTYDPINGRRIYVNGIDTNLDANPNPDDTIPGNLNNWDSSFAFVLGNEVSGDRQWQGVIRLVAVHNRALTPEQINQNFAVGVGQKFFLLFAVTHLVDAGFDPANDTHHAFIMFEVSQFDSYSYLFNQPTFISLDDTFTPANIPLEKMRIGVNGKEAITGQAYRNLMLTLGGSNYTSESGQVLSSIGTIIALENGSTSDEFFLTFENLGGNQNPVVEGVLQAKNIIGSLDSFSDIGLRTFDEINATMAGMTGVDSQVVKPTFDVLRQQLPSVETIQGFLPAHQMGVAQLAIAYCDALVEDTALRDSVFGVINYNNFSSQLGQVTDALFNQMVGIDNVGSALSSAQTHAELSTELTSLDGKLCTAATPCNNAQRSSAVLKAMCASVIGSANMMVQ